MQNAETIPYASPVSVHQTRAPSPGKAAFAVLFGGLALVFLAGCFLIGVLTVVGPDQGFGAKSQRPPLEAREVIFVTVLYAFAFASLAGATVLLFLGTRALLRIALVR